MTEKTWKLITVGKANEQAIPAFLNEIKASPDEVKIIPINPALDEYDVCHLLVFTDKEAPANLKE